MTDLMKIRITELALKSLESEISAEEFAELDSHVSSSKENAHYYTKCVAINMGIMEFHETAYEKISFGNTLFDQNVWDELAEYEKTSPAVEIPKEEPQRELIQIAERPKVSHKVNKLSLFTTLALSAAMLLLLVMLRLAPSALPIIAVLDEQIGTEWGPMTVPLETGSELYSDIFTLNKGFVKIRLNKGAEVLVEGPAVFELLTDNKMMLLSGKLSAKVSDSAKGFTVRTPKATVVDFGTEFGVEVDETSNTTEAHVFDGLVELRNSSDPERFSASKKLKAGMAALVKDSKISKVYKTVPERFAKELPSEYEMATRRSNPKAYWRFTESLTNIIGDKKYSGYVDGGIDETSVMTNSGQRVNALEFDPYKSNVNIDYGDILDPGRSSFTVSMWFKPLSPKGKRRQFMASKRGLNTGWSIMSIDNDIMFRTGAKDDEQIWIGKKNCLTTQWHHVVMVIDRQTNKLKGYLDGSKGGWQTQRKEDYPRVWGENTKDFYNSGSFIESSKTLRIGSKGDSSSSDFSPTDILIPTIKMSSLAFHGLIYDFAVWDRTLSESEIRQLYNKCPLSNVK